MQLLIEILSDYTLRTIALGAISVGIISGVLGSFAVLRKQSLMGDAVSHAALPGLALAFILTGSKSPIVLMTGAAVAGVLGMLLVSLVIRHSRVKEDSALGIVLSVFFGFGLVLLTFIQRMSEVNQAGLDKFLFGQAAALLVEDVVTMSTMAFVALLVVIVFWRTFKLISFDPEFAAAKGVPVALFDSLLTFLTVLAIVVGLQMVGVVLMSAMLIAPAVAARQWTNRLGVMVTISALVGACAGLLGAVGSTLIDKLPTGPTIVIILTVAAVFSILFAPARGLVWQFVADRRRSLSLDPQLVLEQLYSLSLQHDPEQHGHALSVINLMVAPRVDVRGALGELEQQGLVEQEDEGWLITGAGRVALAREPGTGEEANR